MENLSDLYKTVRETQSIRDNININLQQMEETLSSSGFNKICENERRIKIKLIAEEILQNTQKEIKALEHALCTLRILKLDKKKYKNNSPECQYKDSQKTDKLVRHAGLLIQRLQKEAQMLPVWKDSIDKVPYLCGIVSESDNYIAYEGDKVAFKTVNEDSEVNWLLGEVTNYNPTSGKYNVEDIDGGEQYTIKKSKVIPLPKFKVNPDTHPDILFPCGARVYAIYPQTTCFYPGMVIKQPQEVDGFYSIAFEDSTCASGYTQPLPIPQLHLISIPSSA